VAKNKRAGPKAVLAWALRKRGEYPREWIEGAANIGLWPTLPQLRAYRKTLTTNQIKDTELCRIEYVITPVRAGGRGRAR
jgi:hypothetical protein